MSATRPFDSSPALYYKWSIVTMRLSCTVMEIWRLKDNGVTSLTFWSHVTSSVTWPFDSPASTSYGWSIVTMRPVSSPQIQWVSRWHCALYKLHLLKFTSGTVTEWSSVAEWLECWTQVNFTRARGPGFDSWTDPSKIARPQDSSGALPRNIEILAWKPAGR